MNDEKQKTQTYPGVIEACRLLAEATVSGVPCAPVRTLKPKDVDDITWAYAVAQRLTAQVYADRELVGHKIGLTAPVVQAQLGVDQPDFGKLFDLMGVANGTELEASRFIEPRAEGEIAFLLGHDLDAAEGVDITYERTRAAIQGACASIEICDSRVANWDISLVDTVADNASAAGYVLGSWVSLANFEPKEARMRMTNSDGDVVTGTGDACLGDPIEAVRWLANMCVRMGEPLRAGQVILSGALAPMIDFAPGARIEVQIEGLEPVTVSRAGSAGSGLASSGSDDGKKPEVPHNVDAREVASPEGTRSGSVAPGNRGDMTR